mgnify:FL=1|jgi:hypothetical protein|tara:strand:- start:139 stop:375 length:237 start_codon:yes stop_codon:yes gene_type:complete
MNEKDETLEILKLLVSKIQKLEETVYDKENILMKSGFVVANTPVPSMDNGTGVIPDSDTIAKMSWDDINKLVAKMEGY